MKTIALLVVAMIAAVASADPVCCEYKCKGFDTQWCAPDEFGCTELEDCEPPTVRDVGSCDECHKLSEEVESSSPTEEEAAVDAEYNICCLFHCKDDYKIHMCTMDADSCEPVPDCPDVEIWEVDTCEEHPEVACASAPGAALVSPPTPTPTPAPVPSPEPEQADFHVCCLFTCKDGSQIHMCAMDREACDPVPDCPEIDIWEVDDCGEYPAIVCKSPPPTQFCCQYECEGERFAACANGPSECEVLPGCSGPRVSRVEDCASDCKDEMEYQEEEEEEEEVKVGDEELFNCCHYECDGEDYAICVPRDIECEPMDGCDGPKIDEDLDTCEEC